MSSKKKPLRLRASVAKPLRVSRSLRASAPRTRQERVALKLSVKRLKALADALGVFDPLDAEPALGYEADGGDWGLGAGGWGLVDRRS